MKNTPAACAARELLKRVEVRIRRMIVDTDGYTGRVPVREPDGTRHEEFHPELVGKPLSHNLENET